jgi:hypothetical protein
MPSTEAEPQSDSARLVATVMSWQPSMTFHAKLLGHPPKPSGLNIRIGPIRTRIPEVSR